MDEGAHPRKLYGRRKGWKLSAHQDALIETLLPQLTIAPRAGADPRSYFAGPVSDVWLEVGFGGGENLVWQAQHHPAIGMIGAEPFVAGVAKLLSHLVPAEHAGKDILRNVRVYPGDARDVIDALPDASLGRVFILFPDPWPKTRHHKRRFVQMEMLDQLARIMRASAELRFASDDPGYLVYALERLMAHPAFRWTAQSPTDWRTRTEDWPQTRYEQKQLHGAPAFLRFVRT